MINQRGVNGVADRTWIYNTFGFKTWRAGNQDLTIGGHLTFQTAPPGPGPRVRASVPRRPAPPAHGRPDC